MTTYAKARTEQGDKPRWPCRDERDREHWIEFMLEKLDDEWDRKCTSAQTKAAQNTAAWNEIALLESKKGNFQRLKSLVDKYVPGSAKFINHPDVNVGQARNRQPANKWVAWAATLVPLVRRIQMEHCGKKNWRSSDGPSALEIAVSFVNRNASWIAGANERIKAVTVEQVANRLKKGKRRLRC